MFSRLRIWWDRSPVAQRLRRVLWCRWFDHDMDVYPVYGIGGGPPDPVIYCKRCDLDDGKEVNP